MKRKGLSLLEILIASLILTLVLAGLLNTFLAGRRWVLRHRLRMTGGELGKYFLDPLQQQVRQDQWGNNCVSNQAKCCPTPADCKAGTAADLDRTYTAVYTVTPNAPITNINKVRVVISYPEYLEQ